MECEIVIRRFPSFTTCLPQLLSTVCTGLKLPSCELHFVWSHLQTSLAWIWREIKCPSNTALQVTKACKLSYHGKVVVHRKDNCLLLLQSIISKTLDWKRCANFMANQ